MLAVEPLSIPDVKLLRPQIFEDVRGSFMELSRQSQFDDLGLPLFIQENQAVSNKKGTVRGLHFQMPPKAQAKLVRVLSGRLYDVALDLRANSASFGKYVGIVLDARDPSLLYIPAGFAHGYCTLCDNTVMTYKVSNYYTPEAESGVLWNDPDLGISWPVKDEDALILEKDAKQPRMKDLPSISWEQS